MVIQLEEAPHLLEVALQQETLIQDEVALAITTHLIDQQLEVTQPKTVITHLVIEVQHLQEVHQILVEVQEVHLQEAALGVHLHQVEEAEDKPWF